jgi:ribonuclease P protein component
MRAAIVRLKRREEFLKVAATRRKCAVPGLVLQAARGPADAASIRVGFTATKKLGGAVVRNRAKRRLRAAAAAVLPVAGTRGYDYVLVARAGTLDRSWPALLDDLRKALEALAPKGREAG